MTLLTSHGAAGPGEPRGVLSGQPPAEHRRELPRQAGALEHGGGGVDALALIRKRTPAVVGGIGEPLEDASFLAVGAQCPA